MSLDFLPKELENIIVNYCNQIEISEKYDTVVAEFKKYAKRYSCIEQSLSVWYKNRDESTHYELFKGTLIVAKEGSFYEYEETCVIYKDKCYYNHSEIYGILNLIYPPDTLG